MELLHKACPSDTFGTPSGVAPRTGRAGRGAWLLAAIVWSGLGLPGTGVAGSAALGQSLPQAITERAGPLSASDIQTVREHVERQASRLDAEALTGEAIRSARDALLTPLQGTNVTVAFRNEYGRQLEPSLQKWITSGRDVLVFNALRVAGEIATEGTAPLLLPHLSAPSPATRYAAAFATGAAFDAASRGSPAIQRDTAFRLIDALGAQLRTETDLAVVDRLALSLISASRADAQLPGTRALALQRLGESLSSRIPPVKGGDARRELSAEELMVMTRAGDAMRDALSGVGGDRLLPGNDAARGAIKAVAGFGGDLVAYVVRHLKQETWPPIKGSDSDGVKGERRAARDLPASLMNLGELIVYFARVNNGEANAPQTKLSERVKAAQLAEDARVAEDAKAMIGENGALVRQFGFPASRFAS
ncbi:MAG: hypothetical protein SFZ23_12995 [Planctomycetota bacterium]|nr:hypothetical protein [Planctomycetota bacterium]